MAGYIGTARLEADDLDTWELDIEHGFAVDSLDIGFPAVRAVVAPNTDRSGERDTTRFFGGRAVVLSGTILPTDDLSRQAVLDRLTAFVHPARRSWLYFELEPGSGERRIRLRGDQMGRPIVVPGMARVSVGWRGPDGVQEAAEAIEVEGTPAGDQELGRPYDRDYDLEYPDTTDMGDVTLDNTGTEEAYPTILMYGPAEDPRVWNITTGESFRMAGVDLDDEDAYVELDMRAHTATKHDGLVVTDVSHLVEFDLSTWFALAPGENLIRYVPRDFDEGARVTVRVRPTWI